MRVAGRPGPDGPPILGAGHRARRVRAPLEQHPEAVLVEHRHAQLRPPCRTSSPGLSPDDDEVGLLRHRAGRLAAAGLDRLGRAVAGEVVQRAGDDDGEPLERARARRRRASSAIRTPGRPPLVDDRRGASRRRTTPAGRRRWSARRRRPRPARSASAATIAVDRPQLAGQRLRGGRADVADRQRDQDPPQRPLPCAASTAVEQLGRPLAGEPAVLARGTAATVQQLVLVEVEQVALVLRPPRRRAARPRPRSRAPRCRTRRARRRGRAAPAAAPGRTGCWGSGCRRRPPSPARSAVPHSGHSVGMTNSRSVPSRRSTTGPTISGMTSPALRSTTVSPISTPLRSTSDGVVQGGHLDRRAGDDDRLHHAVRRDPAGAPDVDPDVEQLGGDLLGRVLERDRPPRRPRRRAEPALQRDLVDLDHHAVDLVLDVVPVLAVVVDVLLHAGQVVDDPVPVADRQPPAAQRVVRPRTAGPARSPSRAPTPCTTIRSGRLAVTRGSFCRSEPAAALRGLANGALPASTSEALSAAKPSTGKKTSPRTSSSAGTSVARAAGSGPSSRVRTLG